MPPLLASPQSAPRRQFRAGAAVGWGRGGEASFPTIGVVRRKPCDFPCARMGRAGSPCPPEPVMPKGVAGNVRTHFPTDSCRLASAPPMTFACMSRFPAARGLAALPRLRTNETTRSLPDISIGNFFQSLEIGERFFQSLEKPGRIFQPLEKSWFFGEFSGRLGGAVGAVGDALLAPEPCPRPRPTGGPGPLGSNVRPSPRDGICAKSRR